MTEIWQRIDRNMAANDRNMAENRQKSTEICQRLIEMAENQQKYVSE